MRVFSCLTASALNYLECIPKFEICLFVPYDLGFALEGCLILSLKVMGEIAKTIFVK